MKLSYLVYRVTQSSGKEYILRKKTLQTCSELPIIKHGQPHSKEVARQKTVGVEGKQLIITAHFLCASLGFYLCLRQS